MLPLHSDALFAAACLAPREASSTLPPGLAMPARDGAARRFAVHRNTVLVSLIEALAIAFPVVKALVGDDFFHAVAADYVRAHPPRSPVLAQYGERFGDFLATFPPAADWPYLADMARLEHLLIAAYHAADALPADRAILAGLQPEAAAEIRLVRHPAARMLRSPWPVVTLWRMNSGHLPLAPLTRWDSEDALVTRPALDVNLGLLPIGAGALLDALASPLALGVLAARMEAQEHGRLARALPLLLDAGALCPAGEPGEGAQRGPS